MKDLTHLLLDLDRLATAWDNESKQYNKQANELRDSLRPTNEADAIYHCDVHNDLDLQAAQFTLRAKELRDIIKPYKQ